MERMSIENQERPINDESNSPEETLADLPVNDEQARQTKAGGRPTESLQLNFTAIEFQNIQK